MEARYAWTAAAVVLSCASLGAKHRTENFTCEAASPRVATAVCEAAERYRRDLAIEWLGKELPKWSQPCPITVQVGERLGAGGATSFVFDHGEVFGWQMTIQGTYERVLDSVLPHEVTHTIFASYFRRPLPRWADEGACTTVEHVSERSKQQKMLIEFLQTGRGISFSQMFAMTEYPPDVLPLYAQGHSLASFLIAQGGKKKYLQFVADGLETNNWSSVLNRHYGFRNLGVLQNTWLDWVARGSPALAEPTPSSVAAAATTEPSGVVATSAVAAAPPVSPASQDSTPAPSSPPNVYQLAAAAPKQAQGPEPWSGKRLPRPEPNLIHHGAERSVMQLPPTPGTPATSAVADAERPAPIGPGELVPIDFGRKSTQQSDPFATAGASAAAAVQGTAQSSSASRPQTPETPRQVILEWSKPNDPPLDVPVPTPVPTPQYDASNIPTTMLR
jgi:hypothetical protein